jgi:predicted site-specific integrase-resolvase
MARQERSTTFAQESTRPITLVALCARVSTLNNQDPDMQLAELREYAAGCRKRRVDRKVGSSLILGAR